MSFVIDFDVGHRQNLLNLVSYCNSDSVRKKLSAEKEAGTVLVVVGRLEEEGLALEEVFDELKRRYGDKNRG